MGSQASSLEPAILYAAKSSPDEKGSIADQLRKGREWALENGYEIVGEYEDEERLCLQGRQRRRPGSGHEARRERSAQR